MKIPPWYNKPYGPYARDVNAWDDAVRQCRAVLVGWARRGEYGPYSQVSSKVTAIQWADGAWTHHGGQMGSLLGQVAFTERLEGRPLLSAVVVQALDNIPSKGFFDFAREIGDLKGDTEDEELQFWLKEFTACCKAPWPS